jgi:hypothetical protein
MCCGFQCVKVPTLPADVFVDIFFLLDMVVTFNTGRLAHGNTLCMVQMKLSIQAFVTLMALQCVCASRSVLIRELGVSTALLSHAGEYDDEFKTVALSYLSGMFVFDFVTSFPGTPL